MGSYIFYYITITFRSNLKVEDIEMNEELRTQVKLLKALQGIPYKEIAEYLEIKQDSLYCWLKGYYDFGEKRIQQLCYVITCLKE